MTGRTDAMDLRAEMQAALANRDSARINQLMQQARARPGQTAPPGVDWSKVQGPAGTTGRLISEARAAQARGDYAGMMRAFLELEGSPTAAADVAFARTQIGILYEKGLGVPQNYALARQWYGKAIETNEAAGGVPGAGLAYSRLGFLYANGLGGSSDKQAARRAFENAGGARGRDYVFLLDHGALGKTYDDVNALSISDAKERIERAEAERAAETVARQQREQAAYDRAHPAEAAAREKQRQRDDDEYYAEKKRQQARSNNDPGAISCIALHNLGGMGLALWSGC
jgi:hypothetical protein